MSIPLKAVNRSATPRIRLCPRPSLLPGIFPIACPPSMIRQNIHLPEHSADYKLPSPAPVHSFHSVGGCRWPVSLVPLRFPEAAGPVVCGSTREAGASRRTLATTPRVPSTTTGFTPVYDDHRSPDISPRAIDEVRGDFF